MCRATYHFAPPALAIAAAFTRTPQSKRPGRQTTLNRRTISCAEPSPTSPWSGRGDRFVQLAQAGGEIEAYVKLLAEELFEPWVQRDGLVEAAIGARIVRAERDQLFRLAPARIELDEAL